MFNLDQTIAGWRRQMAADGLKSSAVLDELETHLRDDIDRRTQSGASVRQAYHEAVQQLGHADALTNEFAKVGETNEVLARIKHFLLTLAGIQNPILATNMNTSSSNGNLEPAWATCLKSGAFAMPAAVLWLFIVVVVSPKLNEIVSQSAVWMPTTYGAIWFRAMRLLVFLMVHYAFIVGAGAVLMVLILEWRSNIWSRYRRTACGVGVLLLNSIVLISITAMVIIALTVAPMWGRHLH